MPSNSGDDAVLHPVRSLLSRFDPAATLVLALSGGRDSITLLHILARLFAARSLKAVHVHHGLCEQAGDWENFCRRQCSALSVPYYSASLQAPALAVGNMEASARRLRYQALYRHTTAPAVLLTAHHLDDQIETYLYRHFRGVSVHGAGAMAPVRPTPLAGVFLARPLLSVPARDIEAYAHTHRLRWIEDPQNQDRRLERNWLRHELHPLLLQRFPALDAILSRNAQLFRQARELCLDLACIDHADAHEDIKSSRALHYALAPRRPAPADNWPGFGDGVSGWGEFKPHWPRWRLDILRNLSAARFTNLLYCFIRARTGLAPGSGVLAGLMQWSLADPDGYSRLSVRGLNFRRWRSWLWVDDFREEEMSLAPVSWRPGADLCIAELGAPLPVHLIPEAAICNLDQCAGRVLVRARRAGEHLRLGGRSRRLKTLFQQEGTEPWLRARVPVICVDDRPVAISFPHRWLLSDELTGV